MLNFSGSLKVFVAVEACDLRKSFNVFHALVTECWGSIRVRIPCLCLPTGGGRA